MQRTAKARWNGSGAEGSGTLTTQSGTLENVPYSAKMRFGDDKGTNPEELIAAAHAGCYSMALAFDLVRAGHQPQSIETEANLTIERQEAGWRIVKIHLDTTATVPGLGEEEFRKIAEASKAGCPVSNVLKAEITLSAKLAG